MHEAVVFESFSQTFIDVFKFNKWPQGLSITGRRLFLRDVIRRLKLKDNRGDLQRLEQLQQLQQLEQLQRLQRLQQRRISFTNKDYRAVQIKPNSLIYCDIPYKGTAEYGNEFDHSAFFDWAASQKEPVFISEYNIDDKRFHLIKSISHRTTFSQTDNTSVTERLYCNDAAIQKINDQIKNGYKEPVRTKVRKKS